MLRQGNLCGENEGKSISQANILTRNQVPRCFAEQGNSTKNALQIDERADNQVVLKDELVAARMSAA